MGIMATLGVGAKIFGPLIDKYISGGRAKQEFAAELEQALLVYDARVLETQRQNLQAELQGNELQRSWRPKLMLLIMWFLKVYGVALPIWNFILRPIINSILYRWTCYSEPGKPPVDADGVTACIILPLINPVEVWQGIPEEFWTFITISVGGYVVSRGVEKTLGRADTSGDAETVRGPVGRVAERARRAVAPVVNRFDAIRRRRNPSTGAVSDEVVPERTYHDAVAGREFVEVPMSDK